MTIRQATSKRAEKAEKKELLAEDICRLKAAKTK